MLPRRRFTIETGLTPDQARSRLLEAIGQAQNSLFERDGRPFVGTMTGPSFRIMRASRGRNSFRPVVQGSIEPSQGGSRVEGTMGLHQVVIVFLGLLLLVPGWLVLTALLASARTGGWDRTTLAVAGAMVLFVAMVGMGFIVESRRTLADLTAVVKGDPARS